MSVLEPETKICRVSHRMFFFIIILFNLSPYQKSFLRKERLKCLTDSKPVMLARNPAVQKACRPASILATSLKDKSKELLMTLRCENGCMFKAWET